MKNLLILAFSFMLLTFVGCENNDLLLSEKKLNSKIQNNWKVLSASTTITRYGLSVMEKLLL
jgi:hypothetical protein